MTRKLEPRLGKAHLVAYYTSILTTHFSVTWSGGGDIRNDNIKEWTLESLKAVAMSFPDAVAVCE